MAAQQSSTAAPHSSQHPLRPSCSSLSRSDQFMRIQGAVLQANNVWDVLFFKPQLKKVNMCIPAFMQIDMTSQMGPVWILGMPFFRYYHTSFDRTNKQMHFATAGNDCEPLPHSTNKTALLSMGVKRAEDFDAMDADIDAIIPPTLSSLP